MWPNHDDVERVLKTLPSPKPSAESIFQDTAMAHRVLLEAMGRCRTHGRHEFRPVSDIKKFAEDFIGHAIDDTALLVAIRMNGIQMKPSGSDKSVVLAKVPPLERFEEVRDLWNQRQIVEQKQIDEEVKQWAAFRTKHPARVLYGS